MRASQKAETLTLVASSPLPTRQVLARLGLAKSTYYRWRKRQGEGRLEDRSGPAPLAWIGKVAAPALLIQGDYVPAP